MEFNKSCMAVWELRGVPLGDQGKEVLLERWTATA